MKASLTLLAAAVAAASFASAHAAPAPQNATLNPAAQMQKNIHDLHVYGGPKANPAVVNAGVGKAVQTGAGAGGKAALYDDYCGNGIKPIPGVGPQPGPVLNGGARLGSRVADEIEPCGTRVPGRIPGVGPLGPR